MKKTLLSASAALLLSSSFATTALANGDSVVAPAPETSTVTGIIGGGWGFRSSPGYGDVKLWGPAAYARNPRLIRSENYANQLADLDTYGWEIYLGAEAPVWKGLSLGAQVGYHDFGNSNYQVVLGGVEGEQNFPDEFPVDMKISNTAVSGLLTARYTWDSGINLFAKAGGAYVYTDATQSDVIISSRNPSIEGIYPAGQNTNWDLLPQVVVGAGWKFMEHVNVLLSYTHIDGYDDQPMYSSEDIAIMPTRAASQNMVTLGIELSNDFEV